MRQEVKLDCVPVGWLHLIIWWGSVLKSFGDRQGEVSGLEHGHFFFEILIFAGVVEGVSVLDSNTTGGQHVVGVTDGLRKTEC